MKKMTKYFQKKGSKILVLASFFILTKCYSQDSLMSLFVSNNDIKYSILITDSRLQGNKFTPSINLIMPTIDSVKIENYRKLNSLQWIKLLESSDFDWSTNLILYSLFKKDADWYLDKKYEYWIIKRKAIEITYWKDFLIEHLNEAHFRNLTGI